MRLHGDWAMAWKDTTIEWLARKMTQGQVAVRVRRGGSSGHRVASVEELRRFITHKVGHDAAQVRVWEIVDHLDDSDDPWLQIIGPTLSDPVIDVQEMWVIELD